MSSCRVLDISQDVVDMDGLSLDRSGFGTQGFIRSSPLDICLTRQQTLWPLIPVLQSLGAGLVWNNKKAYGAFLRLDIGERIEVARRNKVAARPVPDEWSTQCGCCSKAYPTFASGIFKPFNGHHCRNCGVSVCGDCSTTNTSMLHLPSFFR